MRDVDLMRDKSGNFTRRIFYYFPLTMAVLLMLPDTIAGERLAEAETASYSSYANQSFPTNVYWGGTHLHTNLSVDANFCVNEILGLEDTL